MPDDALDVFLGQPNNITHPSSVLNVEVDEVIKGWRYADDEAVDPQAGHPLVRARIIEIKHLDQFGFPTYHTPAIKSQFFDLKKKKWDQDEAVHQISPDIMLDSFEDGQLKRAGLMTRFGKLIKEYGEFLVKEGREVPLCMLGDIVYGQIIFALELHGVRTIQAFAVADTTTLDAIRANLREHGQAMFGQQLAAMQERAVRRLADYGYAVPKKPKEKAAA